ncbi:divergent protein kinase domain 2A-like [Branchiostoma floridae]|uniref:Divergent protein kinase domain 2A-like n=1 Tax=Branchiostoma floridae TaxID=7739 RepID=A0A9J7KP85_BRAFL|nr:divergent protein kinase domain 2A-like [Branchiostoma floridae]
MPELWTAMDSFIMASARRWCRRLHYSGWTRVLFLLTLMIAIGFIARNYWQVEDDLEARKRISNGGDKKYAQSIQELLAQGIDEKRMREALRQKAEEVHRIVKERGEALAKEAQAKAKANVVRINIHKPELNPENQHSWKAIEKMAAHDEIEDHKKQPEQYMTFKRLMEAKKCPACYGESLCEQAEVGLITMDVADKTWEHKGVYFGHFRNTEVVAKRLVGKDDWTRFDEFICQNASLPKDCDVSHMISDTVLVTDNVLQVSFLKDAWRIAHTRRSIAMEACMTDRLIELIKTAYDENVNRKLSKTERAYMITALLLNPEAALLKHFTSRAEEYWPFPKYIGACGRVILVESGGKLLGSAIESPWKERANIALQVLEMIDKFRNGDPKWVVMFVDFRYDNFAVNNYGRLTLIDFDDVMLIDREEFVGENKTEPCDLKCFKTFISQIEAMNSYDSCSAMPQYSQMMYALACVRLLSHLPEHLSEPNPMDPKPDKHRPDSERPGLLWGPPEQEAKVLEELLRGCVEENVAGGRLEAVGELKTFLRRNAKGEN